MSIDSIKPHPAFCQRLEQYSRDIFSDDKAVRQLARRSLIELTATFQLIPSDADNFKNWTLVSKSMLNFLHNGSFPFQLQNKPGVIHHREQDTAFIDHALSVNDDQPAYIVTMPHVPKSNPGYIDEQINLLWNESFGIDATASRQEADKRMRLVIGVNYCHSISTEKNKSHKQNLAILRTKDSVKNKFLFFSWKPLWEYKNAAKSSIEQKIVKRLFRLMHEVDSTKANAMFKIVMQEVAIPYQRIREEIKNSSYVRSYFGQLTRGKMNRPCFLVSYDDDAVRLRTSETGVFSHYDRIILNNPAVEVATTGYIMRHPTNMFIELATRIDMVGRQAIAQYFPNGAYLPEPNLIIKINSDRLNRNLFIRSQGGGSLESIGVLENLSLMKGDVIGKVIVDVSAPIETSKPDRVTIPNHIPAVYNAQTFFIKKNMSSFRSLPQSSIDPLKGFAANLTRVLLKGFGSQKVHGWVSNFLTCFDPVNYADSFGTQWFLLYPEVADGVYKIYQDLSSEKVKEPRYEARAERICTKVNLPLSKDVVSAFLKEKAEALVEAAKKLTDKRTASNAALPAERIEQLILTGKNTGLSVYRYIRRCQTV